MPVVQDGLVEALDLREPLKVRLLLRFSMQEQILFVLLEMRGKIRVTRILKGVLKIFTMMGICFSS